MRPEINVVVARREADLARNISKHERRRLGHRVPEPVKPLWKPAAVNMKRIGWRRAVVVDLVQLDSRVRFLAIYLEQHEEEEVTDMTNDETTEFKKLIGGMIDTAVAEMGGIAKARQAYEQMPSVKDFIAGWVVRDLWIHRQAALHPRRMANTEETRRILDLVRLRLDTESSTS